MNKKIKELRLLMTEYFNDNELRTLYFDLDLDPEEARTEQKSELIRFLIDSARKQGKLSQLLEACKEQRPNLDWPEINDEDFILPIIQNRFPAFKTIVKRVLAGAGKGLAAGFVFAIVLIIGFAVYDPSSLSIAPFFLLSSILGVPIGILLGLLDIEQKNDWQMMLFWGGLGGLILGMLAGMMISFLVPSTFIQVTFMCTIIGLMTGLVTWAVQSLLPSLKIIPLNTAEEGQTVKAPFRYYILNGILSGITIGAFVGAVFGVFYDVVISDNPFFGITTAIKIEPTYSSSLFLTFVGLFAGAIFLVVYRLLSGRQLILPANVVDMKWSILILLFILGASLILIVIRPLGHSILARDSERPYEARSYVGRVLGRNSEPIKGADVTLILEGIPLETATDADGIYRFTVTSRAETLSGTISISPPRSADILELEMEAGGGYQSYIEEISIEPSTTSIPDIELAYNEPSEFDFDYWDTRAP